jgi:hypothetical protein
MSGNKNDQFSKFLENPRYNWVRWILLLPLSIVIAYLSYKIIFSCLNGIVEAIIGEGSFYETPEHIPFMIKVNACISTLISALAYIIFVNIFTPNNKRVVSLIFLILFIMFNTLLLVAGFRTNKGLHIIQAVIAIFISSFSWYEIYLKKEK